MEHLKSLRSSCAVLLVLTLWLSPASGYAQKVGTQSDDRLREEEEIRAVVLRAQMMDWAQSGDKSETKANGKSDKKIANELNFKTFFVSDEDKDPSPTLLAKLADVPRVLKPVSKSETARTARWPVVDKKTHEHGIIFYVNKIHWDDSESVRVDSGYHCNGLCGAGITFSLKRVDGKWVIRKRATNWNS
jgi:hypothetical protein